MGGGGCSLKADVMLSLEEDKGDEKRGICHNNWEGGSGGGGE